MARNRESILLERALYLVAQEHGYTREQVMAWLNNEDEWHQDLIFPKNEPLKPIDGVFPFVQTSRMSVCESGNNQYERKLKELMERKI